jgi:DUF1365 family protein
MAAIDLGHVELLDRELRLFSLDRPNLFSLYAKDYSTSIANPHPPNPQLHAARQPPNPSSNHAHSSSNPNHAHSSSNPNHVHSSSSPHVHSRSITSTTLVTNLRFAGYAFNPVSFFLRYAGDDLVGVTAEVNNTYGGRHCYALDDSNRIDRDAAARTATDAAARTATDTAARTATDTAARTATDAAARTATDAAARTATDAAARTATDAATRTATDAAARTESHTRVGFRTTREFFVSPFLHGPRVYEWWFPAKRDPAKLAITMHVDTLGGDRIFTATIAGERRELTDRALLRAALRYPINTAQVIGLIHYEAMKLRFLHQQPYRRPGPDHRPLDT